MVTHPSLAELIVRAIYLPTFHGPVPPANQAHRAASQAPQNGPIFASCKMPKFFVKSPLPEAGKHLDFQVTSCLQNVSTSVDFAYIESE